MKRFTISMAAVAAMLFSVLGVSALNAGSADGAAVRNTFTAIDLTQPSGSGYRTVTATSWWNTAAASFQDPRTHAITNESPVLSYNGVNVETTQGQNLGLICYMRARRAPWNDANEWVKADYRKGANLYIGYFRLTVAVDKWANWHTQVPEC